MSGDVRTVPPAPAGPHDLLPPNGRTNAWRAAVPVLVGLFALAVVLRITDPQSIGWMQNFFLVFSGLLVEALPFVLLGALVSAVIEVFVPMSTFERMARLPKAMQLPAAALGGIAFPVCECGSVPVARRLAMKGLAPQAAITFMLAAPILNPVVLASTYFAYRGRGVLWTMVLGRAALGMVVAITVGWVVGARSKDELLRPSAADAVEEADEHTGESRGSRFFGHMGGDFLFMGRFIVVGAGAAAAVQTFVPQSIVDGVASMPILGIVAMMGLAFLLSLCSESDAFVAASFVQFGPASQLSFLVFGPMVDIKLVALYMGIFSKGFARMVVIAAASVTLVACLWLQVWTG
ncbi:MAG: permease [Actinomycetota bacterium]